MTRDELVARLLDVTTQHGTAQSALATAQVARSAEYARAYIDLVSQGESATAADRLASIHARSHQQMIDVARGDIARLQLEHATYIAILTTMGS